jgi:MFS family permease
MNKKIAFAIVVSALGYFVDAFDIILFSALRIPSLKAIGIPPDQIMSVGIQLINIQVLGMFLGGIAWGILGDKRGRTTILFGSIFLYSSATLANAFVSSFPEYAILRFLAGFGLAGELGAGITLVNEMMPKHMRGYGTMLIVVAGALGGLVAGLVADIFSWQVSYIIGGLGGFVLLFLRMGVTESTLFDQIKNQSHVLKGSLSLFLRTPALLIKYIQCLFVGVPFWIFVGVFVALSPEIGKALQVSTPITSGQAIIYFCIGLALGEISSSLLSQLFKSRKKVLNLYLGLAFISLVSFFSMKEMDSSLFYSYCTLLGFSSGFWVLFIMISSEQFGTNIRATVTTSLPNMVRVMVIPVALILNHIKPHIGILWSMGLICMLSVLCAFVALFSLKESFDKSLQYIER